MHFSTPAPHARIAARVTVGLLGSTFAVAPAAAQDMTVGVEIPRLSVAEYHRPYLAAWIEDGSGKAVADVAVWYDTDMRGGEGRKWLSDIRTWWRKSGRSLDLPINGISGPTRAPGRHAIKVPARAARALSAGNYVLRVEAAREVGGREIVSIPFRWGGGRIAKSAKGSKELGTVTLTINP
ncbi:DUF2271 domain-containing protein [Croceicoccus hydrothermalis]|uniref:DUF2271 domain-containing protein n=1 Tax=Croceicoccus hydrothermalis TaxID=2867964 RepID=UPI001EFA31D2|nr:DUF2271 domain-containing protein [Croceicoccus hydrothermalis]